LPRQAALPALKDGYDVYFVSDCSGGSTKEAHDDAKVRMTMAGAKPINWTAVAAEWAPYRASPEVATVAAAYGGSAGLARDYVLAQVTEGVVPLPDVLSQTGRTSD
jgi:hypothetical protein